MKFRCARTMYRLYLQGHEHGRLVLLRRLVSLQPRQPRHHLQPEVPYVGFLGITPTAQARNETTDSTRRGGERQKKKDPRVRRLIPSLPGRLSPPRLLWHQSTATASLSARMAAATSHLLCVCMWHQSQHQLHNDDDDDDIEKERTGRATAAPTPPGAVGHPNHSKHATSSNTSRTWKCPSRLHSNLTLTAMNLPNNVIAFDRSSSLLSRPCQTHTNTDVHKKSGAAKRTRANVYR